MSRYAPRHRPKRDAGETEIVSALRQAGCTVWRKLPVDLLVRVPRDPPGTFRLLEAKPTTHKRGRGDQAAQEAVLAEFSIPKVRSPIEALAVLGIA